MGLALGHDGRRRGHGRRRADLHEGSGEWFDAELEARSALGGDPTRFRSARTVIGESLIVGKIFIEVGKKLGPAVAKRIGEVAGKGAAAAKEAMKRAQETAKRAKKKIKCLFGCRQIKFDDRQVQAKYKHAKDFGVNGNYSKNNAEKFKDALQGHLDDPATVAQGTYGFSPGSSVFFNKNTMNAVVSDSAGNFLTGFKLAPSSPQFLNYVKNGVLR